MINLLKFLFSCRTSSRHYKPVMLLTESTLVFLNTTPSTINVTSMDIFVTGCFNNFETVSCVR